jgi:hypothetical protein
MHQKTAQRVLPTATLAAGRDPTGRGDGEVPEAVFESLITGLMEDGCCLVIEK